MSRLLNLTRFATRAATIGLALVGLLFSGLLVGAGVAAAAPGALAAPGIAAALPAADPLNVTGEITDPNNVLGGNKAAVQAALDDLANKTNLQLFVVFESSFNGMDGKKWADQTANESGLGQFDLLLAVATDEGRYGLSADPNSGLSQSQLDSIQAKVVDKLRAGDWAGAAITAAQATEQTVNGSGTSAAAIVAILVVIALIVVIAVVLLRARSRKKAPQAKQAPAPDELSGLPTAELNRRSSAALVAIDDAMRTSEQELGFAQAQFGTDAAQQFADTLATAKQQVARAFQLRQLLDDDKKDTEEEARGWMTQIIQICQAATANLDAQSKSFDELRQMEANAPQVLDDADQNATQVESRVTAARATLANLTATYPATALASIAHNPDQATALIAQARQSIEQGRSALEKNDRASAVALARAAQNGIGQATTLLNAVDQAGPSLAQAGANLDKGIASITSDIADVARLAPSNATVAPAAAEAQAAVAVARAARGGAPTGDPLAALSRLTAAEAALDTVLAPFREHAEQAARANALLKDTMGRVDSQIRATNDFIETRRGAVGPEARTRLSEAIRLLGQARSLQPTDPVQALASAQQAEQMAQSATQLAQSDASNYMSQQASLGGGVNRGGGPGLGMVLGGIVLGQLLGGGSRGGGGGSLGGMLGGGGFGGGGLGGGFGGGRGGGGFGGGGGGRIGGGGRF